MTQPIIRQTEKPKTSFRSGERRTYGWSDGPTWHGRGKAKKFPQGDGNLLEITSRRTAFHSCWCSSLPLPAPFFYDSWSENGWVNATPNFFQGIAARSCTSPAPPSFPLYIGRIAIILLCLYVASAIFSFIQGYIMSGIAMKVTYMFRKNIAEKIKRMPLQILRYKNPRRSPESGYQ